MAAFTKQELTNAARKAYAEGDLVRAKRFALMVKDLPPESPVFDQNTVLGRATRFMDDTVRVGTDALTRGYADKLMGDQAQADTRASRERLSGPVELGADIAGGVMGAPYRVGGMVSGGIAGGLEGIANAYGHQDNWVPSPQDLADMAYEGGKGAVLGSGLAKVGQKVGDWWSGSAAKAAQKYPTDEALEAASTRLLYKNPQSRKAATLMDRADRVKAARETQGERGAFANLQPGNKVEAAAAKAITEGGGGRIRDTASRGASWLGQSLSGKGTSVGGGIAASGLNLATGGLSGSAGIGLDALGEMIAKSTKISPKELEAYTALIREGGDLRDPKYVDAARNLLAKVGISGAKAPMTTDVGKGFARSFVR